MLVRTKRKYSLPKKFILYIGTIEPRKNVEGIAAAYRNLPPDIQSQYDLVIGGKAPRLGTWVAKLTFPAMLIDTPDVLALKCNAKAQLWDVREDKEFCGKEIKSGAFRAGRVPWAVQADWVNVKVKGNDLEWVTAAEARKTLKNLGFDPGKQQYFYCQSGVRTTQMISTLYALGWPMEKLHNYDGSWIGWSKDDKLPIEKGCPDTTPAPWQKKK